MTEVLKAVPFFDTYMHRMLHRVFFGPDVPAAKAKPKEIQSLASRLVPPGRGWAWNQAVMEFGALPCTAPRPACPDCPLRDHCKTHPKILKALANLPRPQKTAHVPRYEETNRYLRGRVLVCLREEADPEGLLLPDLTRRLQGEAADVGPVKLKAVVESLERDGLARVTPASEQPAGHPAGAVAEQEKSNEIRVSLP